MLTDLRRVDRDRHRDRQPGRDLEALLIRHAAGHIKSIRYSRQTRPRGRDLEAEAGPLQPRREAPRAGVAVYTAARRRHNPHRP